jgi:hypothetical protein
VNDLTLTGTATIQPMSDKSIDKVFELEGVTKYMDQVDLVTWHVLHGGVYSRTIMIPAGTCLTGALVKVPTTLTVCGDVIVFANEQENRLTGYNVISASSNRKQAFIAVADTYLTMSFATSSKSIMACEEEFTDQACDLMSRDPSATNIVNITGE